MKYVFILFLCLTEFTYSLKNKTSESPEGRIVGGYESTSTTRQDWIGQLLRLQDIYSLRCSATLVKKCWAITAAQCVSGILESELRLRFGYTTLSGTIFHSTTNNVHNLYIHPDYNPGNLRQNIALIQLEPCVQFSSKIQPVTLPASTGIVQVGSTCYVSGWGSQSESTTSISLTLREARLPVISNSQCQTWYDTDTTIQIANSELCAGEQSGGPDFCHGDTGSPLVCDFNGVFILQGIASRGEGCGQANHPGIYTRVATYRTWIDVTIENSASLPCGNFLVHVIVLMVAIMVGL